MLYMCAFKGLFKFMQQTNKCTPVKYAYHRLFIIYIFWLLLRPSISYIHKIRKNTDKIQQTAVVFYQYCCECTLTIVAVATETCR